MSDFKQQKLSIILSIQIAGTDWQRLDHVLQVRTTVLVKIQTPKSMTFPKKQWSPLCQIKRDKDKWQYFYETKQNQYSFIINRVSTAAMEGRYTSPEYVWLQVVHCWILKEQTMSEQR